MNAQQARPTKMPRAPVSQDAKLIGLVGGQHHSVIEKDRRILYCTVYEEFRPRPHMCEHCHLRNEAP